MLILSRRIGESICIGDDVTVQLLDITDGCVRVGVRAPQSVNVHRDEIYRRIQLKKIRGIEDTYPRRG
jgi:carbon storage regulator